MSRDATVRSRSSTPCFLLVGSEERLAPAAGTLDENFDDPTLLTHPPVEPGDDWADVTFDVDCIVVDAQTGGDRPEAAIRTLAEAFEDTLLYTVIDESGPLSVEEALSLGATDVAWHDVTGYEVFASRLRGAIEEDATHRFESATRRAPERVSPGNVGDVLDGGTPLEVSRRLVETATDLLGDAPVEFYLHDPRTETLQLTAFSDARDEKPTTSYELGEGSPIARAYLTEETLIGEATIQGAENARSVVVPASGIGVLVVTAADVDVRTVETARLVASLGELAFGWPDAATAGPPGESATSGGHATLLTDVADRVRTIEHELVQTESREAVEQTLCERLVGFDEVSLAWVGRTDTRNGTVSPRSWAGDGEYIERVSIDAVDPDDDTGAPAARTAATGSTTEAFHLDDGEGGPTWRAVARECGHGSVLSLPITFDGLTHGVLTVFGAEGDTFEGVLGTLARELATTAGYAIDAMEVRERAMTDHRVELDCLAHSATTFLPRLVDRLGAGVDLQALYAVEEGARAFFDVPEDQTETFERLCGDCSDVWSVHWPGDDGTCHVLLADPILSTVAAADGAVHGLAPRDDGVHFTVEVPAGTDVADLRTALDVGGDDVDVLARRRTGRSVRSREGALADVERQLSAAELDVLRTAHEAGYFEWPRTVRSTEVAELTGDSQTTVDRRLRASQATVMAELFDR
ncbi:GAF domain-containing protein [Haloarchaeobius amylolyticus]|uniref:GAF domain-containing protein n=1 Tax=Haloarchaeobius amylolyticus TaxID=1198296 RepID=UPI0022722858|nr:GAF domain-containing protein [Haloarchaeobius amylolyticus]